MGNDEINRLKVKCNGYAKRLALLGDDDVVWEAEPTPQNTPSNSDYAKCQCGNQIFTHDGTTKKCTICGKHCT